SVSFGTAVITPRWQYVLAAATPASIGDPLLVDETLSPLDPASIHAGDAVGIGIHATLYPEEAIELGGAHSVVKGDGDVAWKRVLADCEKGTPLPLYAGGQ